MIGTTQNPYVIVIGSLLIGFFKMFPLIEMILPVMFILSPTGDRGKFYAIFYPLSICMGQLGTYLFSVQMFDHNYQAPYFLMAAIMLVIACCSLVFQHNQRFCFKKPLYQIDWLTLVMLSISAMSFNVFFTFMKQQGWFASPVIIGSLVVGILLFALTIYRQSFLKRPLLDFSVFYKKKNVLHSLILLFFLGLFFASASIMTQYTAGVLGYPNLVNSRLNLWMMPGIVLAGVYAFFSFKNKWNLKYYITAGFIAFFVHIVALYFMIQPQMDIRYLEYLNIVRGLGMGILFIGIWLYASQGLTMDESFGTMCILIMVRSFVATAFMGSIISWATYQGQWQSLSDISHYLDQGMFANGMAIYQNISINAMLAASKIVLGAISWAIIPVLIIVLTHSYGQFDLRKIVWFRKVMKGNSVKGYRFY